MEEEERERENGTVRLAPDVEERVLVVRIFQSLVRLLCLKGEGLSSAALNARPPSECEMAAQVDNNNTVYAATEAPFSI